jgi:hypothetical protein
VPWLNWVRRLRFEDAAARATQSDWLAAVEAALQRRSALELALEGAWPQSSFKTTIARLRCCRGDRHARLPAGSPPKSAAAIASSIPAG